MTVSGNATGQLGKWVGKGTVGAVFSCELLAVNGGLTHTLRYTNGGRFDTGNNYVFSDSSAKFQPIAATFNVNRYMWGKAAYSLGGLPVMDPATGLQVQ